MKKIILITIVAMVINTICSAQDEKVDLRKRFVGGLKVGVNLSNVYDSQGEVFTTDPKVGLATGAYLAVPIGRYFGVQPEILFSQKGFSATGNLLGSSYVLTRTTSYLDVPLFFAFKPFKGLTLLSGPQFSYLLRQKDVFANTTTTIEQEQAFENANVRKNTLCFVNGLDININHFVLGGRVGLDVLNNNGDGTSITPRYKNVWFQATVGYRFYYLK